MGALNLVGRLRPRARLFVLCCLIALVIHALKRRWRRQLLLLSSQRSLTPAPPPLAPLLPISTGKLTPLTLQVSITRFKARNLPPESSRLHQLLFSSAAPRQPHVLSLQWGGSKMMHSSAAAQADLGALTWTDRFVFEDTTAAERLQSQLLEVRVQREGGADVGKIRVPLEVLARGPTPNDHPVLAEDGRPSGARLAFRCRVSELREWRMRLRNLHLVLPPGDASEVLGGGSPSRVQARFAPNA